MYFPVTEKTDPKKDSAEAAKESKETKDDEDSSDEESSEEDSDSESEEGSSESDDESEDDGRTDAEKKRQKALARIQVLSNIANNLQYVVKMDYPVMTLKIFFFQKRREDAEKNRTTDVLRAAVVCVLGHVDTGTVYLLPMNL